jgi:hypothetical protein
MSTANTPNPVNDTTPVRQQIIDYVKSFLGGNMVDVELEPKDYNTAIDRALAKYRQKSSNSVEESYGFLTLEQDQNEYILGNEVVEVRDVFRRSIGSRSGGGDGGTLFEPFNLAYTNTYLLSSSNMGGLGTYYAFAQYQKMVGKMFGSYIQFTYHPQTRKLTIMQRPRGEENVLLWLYNHRPDFALLDDPYAGLWIKDYTLANCKLMLGEAREKFNQITGPQGGTTLNGTQLKSEGAAQIEALEADMKAYGTGEKPMWFVVG